MNLTNQLLQYSEQERLALISCITSIATIDKVANEDEIDFVLALIEATDLDAIKMKSAVDNPTDFENLLLQSPLQPTNNTIDALHLYRRELPPLTPFNTELAYKTNYLMQELQLDLEHLGAEEQIAESFLEKMVLSLYMK